MFTASLSKLYSVNAFQGFRNLKSLWSGQQLEFILNPKVFERVKKYN